MSVTAPRPVPIPTQTQAIVLSIRRFNGSLVHDRPGLCASLGPGGSLVIQLDQNGSLKPNAQITSLKFYSTKSKANELWVGTWNKGESRFKDYFEVTEIMNGNLTIGVILTNIDEDDSRLWYTAEVENEGHLDPEIDNKAGDPPGSAKWVPATP